MIFSHVYFIIISNISIIYTGLTPFNGTLLYGTDAIDEDHGEFKVKYLMADINLGEYGFLRIGRQPFDFGLGIYANGGHNPYDDQGFQLDRVLWLKGYDTALGATTLVLVSDYMVKFYWCKCCGG